MKVVFEFEDKKEKITRFYNDTGCRLQYYCC